ncbi:MAG TPA: Smr/MutS family protein [Xanthobacteraceae bacterium]|jgi:DNA-nicking Smr family endonuclease|nr:Smr/MutS family protein [Xanthobacteraceae bacterium]
MSRRRVSEEEHSLWAGIAREVTPLRKAAAKAKPAAPAGELAAAPPRPAKKTEAPPLATPLPLVALDRRLKQRVARGNHAIAARIDLHGMTQRQAHAALIDFLRRAQADDARLVLVVTGKGRGTSAHDGHERGQERGVLRRQVPMWLALPEFRRFVVGFDEAHHTHGGQGALYVRVRRPR